MYLRAQSKGSMGVSPMQLRSTTVLLAFAFLIANSCPDYPLLASLFPGVVRFPLGIFKLRSTVRILNLSIK